jgi:hypothetical protein
MNRITSFSMDKLSVPSAEPSEYRIMAIAPFGAAHDGLGNAANAHAEKASASEKSAIEKLMAAMAPGVTVMLPKEYCPDGFVVIGISSVEDFEPQELMRRQPYLAALAEALRLARSAEREGLAHCEVRELTRKLLPMLTLDFTPPARQSPGFPVVSVVSSRPPATGGTIDDLLAMVDTGSDGASPSPAKEERFTSLQMQIETVIRQVMRRIFADEGFRTLESAWRGVALLLDALNTPLCGKHEVSVTLVSCDNRPLEEVLEELTQLPAPQLPNMVLIVQPVANSLRGFALLERLIEVADRLMLPVAAWVGPSFFTLAGWEELGRLPYLPNLLDQPSFARWRTLRKRSGAEWCPILVNSIVARPLHSGPMAECGVSFSEGDVCLISPVWALGALTAMAVSATGWAMNAADSLRFWLKGNPALELEELLPLEIIIPDERLEQFIKAGFSPLSASKRDNRVALAGLCSLEGSRLELRLFFAQLLSFLFRLQQQQSGNGTRLSADLVTSALERFFARGEMRPPDDLTVRLVDDSTGGKEMLNISFTPAGIAASGTIEINVRL